MGVVVLVFVCSRGYLSLKVFSCGVCIAMCMYMCRVWLVFVGEGVGAWADDLDGVCDFCRLASIGHGVLVMAFV